SSHFDALVLRGCPRSGHIILEATLREGRRYKSTNARRVAGRKARASFLWPASGRTTPDHGYRSCVCGPSGRVAVVQSGHLPVIGGHVKPKAHRPWSAEEDRRLIELRASGRRPISIAAALKRSRAAVATRLSFLRNCTVTAPADQGRKQ